MSADLASRRNSPSTSAASDGGEDGFAGGGCSERSGQLVDRRRLEEVSGGAGRDGIEEVALRFADGQDHDRADGGALLHDGQAATSRHVEIAHDQVGNTGGDDVDRALGIVGFTDDLEIVAEFRAEPRTEEFVIVGEHGADGRSVGSTTSIRDIVVAGRVQMQTSVPLPMFDEISTRPPMASMRASIDSSIPWVERGVAGSNPMPSSSMLAKTWPSSSVSTYTTIRFGDGVFERVRHRLADRTSDEFLVTVGESATVVEDAHGHRCVMAGSDALDFGSGRSSPGRRRRDPRVPKRNARRSWSA